MPLRVNLNGTMGFHGKKNPPRAWILCIICAKWAHVKQSNLRFPRSRTGVPLCGRSACHIAWKMCLRAFSSGDEGLRFAAMLLSWKVQHPVSTSAVLEI